MSFAKVQRTYEQLDEFALATEVNAMVEGPIEGKPVLVAIFKKDFAIRLRKRTWIKIDAYDKLEFSLNREVWHQYEVPMTPALNDFYEPNLFDFVFKDHADFTAVQVDLLKDNKDCMLCPVPLYESETMNTSFKNRRMLVLDGRVYGGVSAKPVMVKRSWQDALEGTPESECEAYALPIYRKCDVPRSFLGVWDLNDGLSVYVGMEVVLSKKFQEVEGLATITNKVTNVFLKKTQTNMLYRSDSGSLH